MLQFNYLCFLSSPVEYCALFGRKEFLRLRVWKHFQDSSNSDAVETQENRKYSLLPSKAVVFALFLIKGPWELFYFI